MANDAGLLADLRYSYAKADQWRAGAAKKATEQLSGADSEIENKRTINQIATLSLDYSINRQWGIALAQPFVVREHAHTVLVCRRPIAQHRATGEIQRAG